jgi:hypothetical protein
VTKLNELEIGFERSVGHEENEKRELDKACIFL